MKHLILTASLFLSATAFAQSVKLPKDTIALNTVSADILAIKPLCPKGTTCITNGTTLLLSTVGGCLDKLLPVTYEKIGNNVVAHVQVAVNKDSSNVMCIAAPVLTDEITLIGVYPPFTIQFLGTGQSLDVSGY